MISNSIGNLSGEDGNNKLKRWTLENITKDQVEWAIKYSQLMDNIKSNDQK
jgi:hypothetical protein